MSGRPEVSKPLLVIVWSIDGTDIHEADTIYQAREIAQMEVERIQPQGGDPWEGSERIRIVRIVEDWQLIDVTNEIGADPREAGFDGWMDLRRVWPEGGGAG